jgi:hypothetical protein
MFRACQYEAEGKLFPVHTVKAYRGSRGLFPLILNHSARWRFVVSFTSRSFNPEKTGGDDFIDGCVGLSESGRFGEDKSLFPLSE